MASSNEKSSTRSTIGWSLSLSDKGALGRTESSAPSTTGCSGMECFGFFALEVEEGEEAIAFRLAEADVRAPIIAGVARVADRVTGI